MDTISPDLALRLARLEGKVDTLLQLFAPLQLPGKPVVPNYDVAVSGPDVLPEQIIKAVDDTAVGNRSLKRYLTGIALQMARDGVEPDLIARKIRTGEAVD
jgi:hypothetical protein